MKFLVPNYSCLQNTWLRGCRPKIPVLSVLCPQLNLLNPPTPEQNSWVRPWFQPFLTPPLDGGNCHLHDPTVLPPGDETSVPIIFNILYKFYHKEKRQITLKYVVFWYGKLRNVMNRQLEVKENQG